jgi:hypothetical protein
VLLGIRPGGGDAGGAFVSGTTPSTVQPAIDVVRVASVPAGHPYVRHLTDPDGDPMIVRLPDPGDPWWPPRMLRPDWLRDHAGAFDLMHVHFGFDACSPGDLGLACEILARQGKPLVVTVHDLRNPHHDTPELHRAQLGVLLDHASAVVTLTEWAADRIRHTYGRDAQVIPHPHIVELDEMRARQARRRPPSTVVGLHLKSLRPNMERRVLGAAIEAVGRVAAAVLRVDVHCDVASPTGLRYDEPLVAELVRGAEAGALDLHVHDFFDDAAFVDYLAGLRVSVLPYRFGTHSGWLEACRDLGVAVVAPDCGAYADQGAAHTFGCNEDDGFDAASCVQTIEDALVAPRPEPVSWRSREAERRRIAARHRALYRALVTGR